MSIFTERLIAERERTNRIITVGDLKKFLAEFPDDTPVVESRYSDCQSMQLEDWSARRVLLQRGHWHRLLGKGESEKGLKNVVDAVYFQGN